MRGRILFGTGLLVGWVLGARAGRGAYDRLRQRADDVVHSPQVGRAVDAAVQAAGKAAPELTGTVQGAVAAVAGTDAPASETAGAKAGSGSGSPTIGEGTRATAPSADDETATATD